MDLSKYRNKLIGSKDERAVSPVIGVILMVAITVILAAVIAAFVLDMGDLDESAPNAQYEWEVQTFGTDDRVTVTLTSGDDIETDNLAFNGGGEDTNSDVGVSGDTWTAGETFVYDTDSGDFQIVWEGDGSSSVIAEESY
ncbi:type IV pilin [Natronorubrum halophilum]|uniref:type IV pilin n=1 Tax=Natronorubrum halophilum TaxID=1702106 RepID=UPI0010C18348|nr:type IV pilin N-terminal domain-containing protein [Natronorubrum halophilum]